MGRIKEELAEIKLARKILKKHNLSVPFDLLNLVCSYAEVIFKRIPFDGVDGLCLNLKTPNKQAKIIIDTTISESRKNFTLAHELGHVIIPWHLGNIIDFNVEYSELQNYLYSIYEGEANRFAAEILMPKEWVLEMLNTYELNESQKIIVKSSKVSALAAALKILDVTDQNICLYVVLNNKITLTKKSSICVTFTQDSSNYFDDNFHNNIPHDQFIYTNGAEKYHWIKFKNVKLKLPDNDKTWREILDEILIDTNLQKKKGSINGIISHENGRLINNKIHTKENLFTNCLMRLKRDELINFCKHPKFEEFLTVRIEEFFK
jgi:Zn-dependent peptidase ImmA (M78 family)